MAVHKALARLRSASGAVIGEGRAYIHLRRPDAQAQAAQGTLSLDWWDEASSTQGARLELADGPTLPISVDSDHLRGCVTGRVLRYQTDWPGAS